MQQTSRAVLTALVVAIALTSGRATAQVFITNTVRIGAYAGWSLSVQNEGPTGQSFTAATNAIGWVSLLLDDSNPSNGLPATLHVNLRTIVQAQPPVSGAILSSSYPTTITNGHFTQGNSRATRFVFPTNVPLVEGTQYWWELVWDAGDDVLARYYHFGIPGGDVIAGGTNFGFSVRDMSYNYGTIAQYPELKNPRIDRPALHFTVDPDGVLEQPIVVEISTDLVTWVPYLTNAGPLQPLFLSPLNASNAPPRAFYRARYLDPH